MTAVTQPRALSPEPKGWQGERRPLKMELLWVEQPPRSLLYTQAPGWGWGVGVEQLWPSAWGRGTEGSEGAAGLWSVTLPAAVLQCVAGFTLFVLPFYFLN